MNVRLKTLPASFKWALSLYFFLVTLGFGFAALMSHNRYDFDHEKTVQYYLGDPADGPDAFQKPYAQLLGVTHVHSFVLPLVFLTIWIGLQGIPLRSQKLKILLYIGGTLSILIYNAAPYLVRFVSPHWVIAFTIGGIGLFVFSFVPIILIFYEMLLGFKQLIANSEITLIRNDEIMNSLEASRHIRDKYEYYRHEIKTPEDFIAQIGSRSIVSGKAYEIKTKEGKVLRLDEWLTQLLMEYREKEGRNRVP